MAPSLASALVVASAAVARGALAAGGAVDVPIYCRLLALGLEEASFQPVLKDIGLSTVAQVPALGPIDVSVDRLEVGTVKLVSCGASVDTTGGHLNVGIRRLDVELKQLSWKYQQRDWPHSADEGVGAANTSMSFNVTIDTAGEKRELFAVEVGKIELDLGAKHHSWLSEALEKLTKFMRPLVSKSVQYAAEKAMDSSLGIMRKQGGCAFLGDALKGLDLTKLKFTSVEPFTQHVPLVGDVNISANSTYVTQPTSMHCEHVGFNGSTLIAHVDDVPFSAGFVWAYQKVGSTFWHNKGSGTADVVAGTFLYIDLIRPSATYVELVLPELTVHLKADADTWMYKAVAASMASVVRESMQLFGGRLLGHYVAECLADPKCPRLHPGPKQMQASETELVVV